MVRAAVTGAIDYSRADPTNSNWRLQHILILTELQRQEELKVLEAARQQWLAYVSHGNLTPESFSSVKEHANKTLISLQKAVFPWAKTESAPAPTTTSDGTIIDAETQKLIDNYRAWQASLAAEKEAKEKKA